MPILPKLPNPEDALNIIDKAGEAISKGLELIDRTTKKLDRLAGKIDSVGSLTLETSTRAIVPQTLSEENPSAFIVTTIREPRITDKQEDIAIACVACAVGHFSTSSGLLKEAMRFKNEGMTSNEILDRIAAVLEEQNTLERVDLTPERLQKTPGWERAIAEEALTQSRQLRHKLENIQSIGEMEALAANTKRYYIKLFRQWNKGRFGYLGADKAEAIAQRVGEK